jgi:rubrerythrin
MMILGSECFCKPTHHTTFINVYKGLDGERYECSRCGWEFKTPVGEEYNFCPRCGARIDWYDMGE